LRSRKTVPKTAYLGGNPPMSWLKVAGLAGSRALRVGLYLLHLRGMRKTSEDLLVTQKGALQVLGIHRSSLTRGIGKLESVGLITATRGRGKAIRVTLLKLEAAVSSPPAPSATAPAEAPQKFVLAPSKPSGIHITRITEEPRPPLALKILRTEVPTITNTSKLPEEVCDK
jgi:hypothetical protein